jgi:hypothetical protein
LTRGRFRGKWAPGKHICLFWGTATDERCQFFLLTFHFPLLFFVLASELFSGGVDRPREVERFKGVNLKTVTIKSPGVQALLCSAKKRNKKMLSCGRPEASQPPRCCGTSLGRLLISKTLASSPAQTSFHGTGAIAMLILF